VIYIAFMCGRFTRNYTWQQIHALYRLTAPAAIPNFQPRFNVCPTDPADVVVPNEGAREPGGKQPNYFTARDGSPVLTIAGLWDEWKNRETGERIKSCTMIICQPNEFVAEAHDRMPVLLQPRQFEHWLSGDMGVEELKPAPNDYLQRWAVSKRVNSSKADKDDATLIKPIELPA
jgi:putative SOS response-associated peptidase YedK